mmetsp:Transcript_74956/g.216693  ORF Transcript_74956/g.216693 Transcript_74956/m.216693 type:complete len:294 (-) Transcript_74956:1059-1940(-)
MGIAGTSWAHPRRRAVGAGVPTAQRARSRGHPLAGRARERPPAPGAGGSAGSVLQLALPQPYPIDGDRMRGAEELDPEPRSRRVIQRPTELVLHIDVLRAGDGLHPSCAFRCVPREVHQTGVLIGDDVEQLLTRRADDQLKRVQVRDTCVRRHEVHAPTVEGAGEVEALAEQGRWRLDDLSPDGLAVLLHLHLEDLADVVLGHRHAVGLPLLGVVRRHHDRGRRGVGEFLQHLAPVVARAARGNAAGSHSVLPVRHGVGVRAAKAERAHTRVGAVVHAAQALGDELRGEALHV